MINLVIWIIAGAVIGGLATLVMRRRHPILLLNIILGSVGAVVAGYLLPRVFHIDTAGFGLLVSMGGAIFLVVVVNFFVREHTIKDSVFKGQWNQVRDKIHTRWNKITEEDTEQINGDHDRLINLLVERYGIPNKEAEDQYQRYLKVVTTNRVP
jgi:uncharacterized membrane protein YeaQ/YmgE (transglycosylase-associated protein family)/uncharacterized protein YjbJ (UPF0337 family)